MRKAAVAWAYLVILIMTHTKKLDTPSLSRQRNYLSIPTQLFIHFHMAGG